ncbi:MAG: PAS domain-containing protein [Thiobacillaceae bacterium]
MAEYLKRPQAAEAGRQLAGHSAEISQEYLLLRTLIDNLPDCIYAKDSAGRKTMANPADLKNLRCKTEDEAVGKSDFDLFPKDVAEKFWADDQAVIQGQPVIDGTNTFGLRYAEPLRVKSVMRFSHCSGFCGMLASGWGAGVGVGASARTFWAKTAPSIKLINLIFMINLLVETGEGISESERSL